MNITVTTWKFTNGEWVAEGVRNISVASEGFKTPRNETRKAEFQQAMVQVQTRTKIGEKPAGGFGGVEETYETKLYVTYHVNIEGAQQFVDALCK